jgi:invasion protein IalB
MTLGFTSGHWMARCLATALLLWPAATFAAETAASKAAAQQAQGQQAQGQQPSAQQAPGAATPAAEPQAAPDQPPAAPQNEQPQPPQASRPVNAQQQQPPGTVKSTHGAWSIVCDKPNTTSNDQCGLIQDVVAEDRPEMTLSVIVLNSPARKTKVLRVRAPLNILLPNGLGLNVDGKDIGRVNFTRCFSDGCYAEAVLQDDLLKVLRTGKLATFILFQTPEEGIGIPVELKGFAEGYDALQ